MDGVFLGMTRWFSVVGLLFGILLKEMLSLAVRCAPRVAAVVFEVTDVAAPLASV